MQEETAVEAPSIPVEYLVHHLWIMITGMLVCRCIWMRHSREWPDRLEEYGQHPIQELHDYSHSIDEKAVSR